MILRLILATGLFCLGASSVYADWTEAQRAVFSRNCIPGCQENPLVAASQKSKCAAFCSCHLAIAERTFPNYDEMKRLDAAKDAAAVNKLNESGEICNRRVFVR